MEEQRPPVDHELEHQKDQEERNPDGCESGNQSHIQHALNGVPARRKIQPFALFPFAGKFKDGVSRHLLLWKHFALVGVLQKPIGCWRIYTLVFRDQYQ